MKTKEEILTMEEYCFICGKKQGVNQPYTQYEGVGSLCPNCESNKDLKKGTKSKAKY